MKGQPWGKENGRRKMGRHWSNDKIRTGMERVGNRKEIIMKGEDCTAISVVLWLRLW
jgi:hypothetical protein